jgi:hypothetical protein
MRPAGAEARVTSSSTTLFSVTLAVAGWACSFDTRGGASADAGELGAIEDCADWHPATPFDPCDIDERGGELLLAAAGTYDYDTTEGLLRFEGGAPITHVSFVTADGARLISAARIQLGPDSFLRVTGRWPLLLVSWTEIAIAGTLDASSSILAGDGAGANPAACGDRSLLAGGPGSGGGGGGLATPGGGGGGIAPAAGGLASDLPIGLRGGCPGGDGGGAPAALGGSGGGSVGLAARSLLSIGGRVLASGGAGQGGGLSSGGAGAGSGGLVWLDAPDIALADSAILSANGGGGGEGGDDDDTGADGESSSADGRRARHGGGDANEGGDGGDGAADHDTSGKPGKSGAGESGGGGGGGGGGGSIRLSGTVTDAGARITPLL